MVNKKRTRRAFEMNRPPQVWAEPKTYTREELDRKLEARKQKDIDLARRAELARTRKGR